MLKLDPNFIGKVKKSESFNAAACLNCGACTAVCEMGIELLPRKLFHYVLLGIREKVEENIEIIYSCLLCKMCEVNCPRGVHIAENVRSLRYYVNQNVFHL
ncbi:MAG TPA: 4Fe-4S dicluster domain-containing protein [Spirochaetia bacterium]|nr:4Fe-4S dicluster domain-containing protein [Spirochaetia bacterium]